MTQPLTTDHDRISCCPVKAPVLQATLSVMTCVWWMLEMCGAVTVSVILSPDHAMTPATLAEFLSLSIRMLCSVESSMSLRTCSQDQSLRNHVWILHSFVQTTNSVSQTQIVKQECHILISSQWTLHFSGASCVLSGSKFYCQCSLGYYFSSISTSSCPVSGTCSARTSSGPCDCYSSSNITVCPYCSAQSSISSAQLQYSGLTSGRPGTPAHASLSLQISAWASLVRAAACSSTTPAGMMSWTLPRPMSLPFSSRHTWMLTRALSMLLLSLL